MPDTITADLLLGRDSLTPGLLKAGKAASDASGNVGDLTRRLYELNKARATPVVDLNDKAASAHLEEVKAKLNELGSKVAKPKIDANDKAALASVASMRLQLDRLGHMVASPKVTLEGVDRAQAQLLRLDAQLSRMTVKRGLFSRLLGGLFGGGGGPSLISGASSAAGGAAGGAAQAGGGIFQSLGPYGQGILAALGITAGTLLAPGAIPLGLGALVGGGGLFGGITLGKTAATNLQALQTSLKSATGKQREIIRDQIAAFKQANAGPLAVNAAFTGLTGDFTSVFSGALMARGRPTIGPGGRPIPGSGAPSFLTSILGILKQIGGFIKTIGPSLGDLFRASAPYISTFAKFLEQATKTLLPVFTHLLQEFTPLLPSISKGLLEIVKGFAGFLKALGPQGMQASVKLFLLLAKALELVLPALGTAINWLAEHVPIWAHNIAAWFDRIRHWSAALGDDIMHFWDGWRHGWAHIWDVIFQDTIGKMIRFGHNVEAAFNTTKKFLEIWVARIEILFAGWAKNILHYAQDAFGWLPGWLPGVSGIQRGLTTAQKDLANFTDGARNTLNRLTGKKYALDFSLNLPAGVSYPTRPIKGRAGGGGVTPGEWSIVGERGPELAYFAGGGHVIPNHALKGYAAGSGAVTVHLSTPSLQDMARVFGTAVSAIVTAVRRGAHFSGGILPGVSGLGRAGLRYLENLWMSAGGPGGGIAHIAAAIALAESGGNPRAFNPSGASGLWQILGQVVPGNIFNPYINALNAVRKFDDAGGFSPWVTYETGAYRQYLDQGGWLRPGWNLAYNGTGRPERVVPHGRSGSAGTTYNVYVTVGHGTHPVAAAQELVKILNQGARNGVKLRTSILGPG